MVKHKSLTMTIFNEPTFMTSKSLRWCKLTRVSVAAHERNCMIDKK